MEQTDRPEPQWYAANVRSRHEFKATEKLISRGIETFLPTVERLRKWKDRNKLIVFPLFPGYIFVRTTKESENLLSVLKVPGIVRMLCTIPGLPDEIPEDQITSLKKLVDNKEALDPYPYLTEGQMVRIIKGPLAGVEGILNEKVDKHVLVLSVDVLRQGVALTINAADVEKI